MEAKQAVKRWSMFAAGLFLAWAFMFELGPAFRDTVPAFRTYAATINELGFNTGAVYYTDVDVVPRASLSVRSTFDYTPKGVYAPQSPGAR